METTAPPPVLLDADDLMRTLYDELHRLADACVTRWLPEQTLETTDVLNEAYARLVRGGKQKWQNRGHFFGAAYRAMFELIVDYSKRKHALRRGGGWVRVDTSATIPGFGGTMELEDRLEFMAALERLQREHPKHAELVMLRFTGLQWAEIAELQGVTRACVEKRWRFARARLVVYVNETSETLLTLD